MKDYFVRECSMFDAAESERDGGGTADWFERGGSDTEEADPKSSTVVHTVAESKPHYPSFGEGKNEAFTEASDAGDEQLEPLSRRSDVPVAVAASARSNEEGDAKVKREWRYHTEYYRHFDNQQYFFLLGFSRGGYKKYPKIIGKDIEFTSVQQKGARGYSFLQRGKSVSEPRSSNELLFTVGKDYLQAFGFDDSIEDQLYEGLQQLARRLCEDESVQSMFGFDAKQSSKAVAGIRDAKKNYSTDYFQKMVVGFDWFGDEFGDPFCLFSHPEFVSLVKLCTEQNSRFGIRLHAGEGLVRPSSTERHNSPASIAFTLHLYVLMESIYKYFHNYRDICDGKGPNFRIGHGVAFLYGLENENRSRLSDDVRKFRDFLKDNGVVFELNPTSNHMLLPDTFSSEELSNCRSLRRFLHAALPVVLCTDDDGIWALNKCTTHHQHISVAHEYCAAIQNDGLTESEIETMVHLGHKSKFREPLNKQRQPFSG